MFTCQSCGRQFDMAQEILERYPGWQPSLCRDCHRGNPGGGSSNSTGASVTRARDLTTSEVLATFHDGPKTGVFTDGSSEGNPGPGGWGAVFVVDDEVVAQDHGSEAHTTNNRMELTAMIAGLGMVPPGEEVDVYSDSQLVVNIITRWAEGWETNGWKKKSRGAIANLDLVKEAYALAKQRPGARITWIRAHRGYRWNEYADALATAYRRQEL